MNMYESTTAPIYIKLFDMIERNYIYLKNMEKIYSRTIGDDSSNILLDSIKLFVDAFNTVEIREKVKLLQQIKNNIEKYETELKIMSKLKIISLKQEAIQAENIANVKLQINSWLKSLNR